MRICGLILAGGQGRRMSGEDKGLLRLADKTMIEWVIERLLPQVDEVLINANRNIERYRQFDCPVIQDEMAGYQGPLAGMLSGLKATHADRVVCVPCDTPFFPDDLVDRMLAIQADGVADVVSVCDGTRTHPVFAMLKSTLAPCLNDYLAGGGRKIDHWYQQQQLLWLTYPDGERFFANINTPEQLQSAERRIRDNA